MALVESGLADSGWGRAFGGKRHDEQAMLKEIYELAQKAGWDRLATKKKTEHGRQAPPVEDTPRPEPDPKCVEQELALVRAESDPDSSVYVPPKRKLLDRRRYRRKA